MKFQFHFSVIISEHVELCANQTLAFSLLQMFFNDFDIPVSERGPNVERWYSSVRMRRFFQLCLIVVVFLFSALHSS